MKTAQFCVQCNCMLEEAVVDGRTTIVCWDCHTTGQGYLIDEANLVQEITEILNRENFYMVMPLVRLYRRQAQPLRQILKACRDLLNEIAVMDDNELWSDVPTARVTEFAEAVRAAEVQA